MNKIKFAPIALFAYKREKHLLRTLEALNRNTLAEQTELIIYADGAKGEEDASAVEKVRQALERWAQNSCFKSVEIIKSEHNKGLAKSIIQGVTEVLKRYERVIVVEDDLVTTSDFIMFMNDCLEYYEKEPMIGAISGYTLPLSKLKNYPHDIYVSYTGNSWGWATWKQIWDEADWEVKDYYLFQKNRKERKQFDGIQYNISKMLDLQMQQKVDSWAVRWDYYFFKKKYLTVYPAVSKVMNEGFDGTGTHCDGNMQNKYAANAKCTQYTLEKAKPDRGLLKKTANYGKNSILKKILKGMLNKYS